MVDKVTRDFYQNYEPTVEDLLGIQEYFDECRAVAERRAFRRGEICRCEGEITVCERESSELESALISCAEGS